MKLHVYWLSGPLLAILFPVTSTRLLPGEVGIYWIQHSLIMIIPFFLMIMNNTGHRSLSLHDVLRSELPWSMLSLAILSLYHWLVLQPLGKHKKFTPRTRVQMNLSFRSDNFGESEQYAVSCSFRSILQSILQTYSHGILCTSSTSCWISL